MARQRLDSQDNFPMSREKIARSAALAVSLDIRPLSFCDGQKECALSQRPFLKWDRLY